VCGANRAHPGAGLPKKTPPSASRVQHDHPTPIGRSKFGRCQALSSWIARLRRARLIVICHQPVQESGQQKQPAIEHRDMILGGEGSCLIDMAESDFEVKSARKAKTA